MDRSKAPAVGERKALRRRIVLSNTNALEVQGMEDISVQSMLDEGSQGKVFGIPGSLVDQLRAVDAFKVSQGWGLFRRPGMLVRKETVEYGKLIEELSVKDNKKTVRRVLVGERGSGKSLMLLQAMTMAFLKKWTVVNISEGTLRSISPLELRLHTQVLTKLTPFPAQDLTIGHTAYAPIPRSQPTLYAQPSYTSSLLSKISQSNPHLSTLRLTQPPHPNTIPTPLPPSLTLSGLCALGAQDPDIAWPIFQLLMSELSAPGLPPILLCIDGLANAMQPTTAYTTPSLGPIHAHDFALIKWFTSYLSGQQPLPNGGIVLAATSQSNAPVLPSLTIALTALETPDAREAQRDPFRRLDERVLSVFEKGNGVEVQRLKGVSKDEARALMEYWARSGLLRARVSEGFVGEKWALSGGGVVGELERATVRGVM